MPLSDFICLKTNNSGLLSAIDEVYYEVPLLFYVRAIDVKVFLGVVFVLGPGMLIGDRQSRAKLEVG